MWPGGAEPHAAHNVVAAFVEAHPEFLREQEEIERLDGTDRLSEALMHRRSGKMTF